MNIHFPSAIAKSDSFEGYMAYVTSLPVLDEEREKLLFQRFHQQNDLNAVQEIVVSHLRFVAFIARSYKGYGLPLEDLVQEGTVGLMKSVKKFSLDYGVRLASYAVHHIKSEIHEYIVKNWRLVKATTTKAKRKLFFNLRRLKPTTNWLTLEEKKGIAQQLGVTEQDVTEIEVQLAQSDVFLDAPCSTDNDNTLEVGEFLLADQKSNVENSVSKREFEQKVKHKFTQLLARLDDRSRDIITQRWLTDDKVTHKALAEKYHVSHERIRQIEEKTLLKLKRSLLEFSD
ncbi:RNA polymerase factor sigma-32 [Thalassotalea marina]|uniref:RNA polymerase sigma factor RpoH n=1 Tax=Thalassotalea marina TaxID=1673741 RepID=A0A919BJH3_9GAMM|nr:RNA polymerase factor sigma-32 [Thalassotalea marina]GHF94338.1 RNA polymerase sigma factor RpoH [Thalassotalea marina]